MNAPSEFFLAGAFCFFIAERYSLGKAIVTNYPLL